MNPRSGMVAPARLPWRGVLAGAVTAFAVAMSAPAAQAAPADYDLGFGTNGFSLLEAGGNDRLHGVTVAPDGKVVAVGETSFGDNGTVFRLGADGRRDTSFSTDGLVPIHSGSSEALHGVVVQPDGKIVVAGYTTLKNDVIVYRLNTDGSFDTSFDADGAVGIDSGGDERGYNLALQPDGKILVVGSTSINENAVIYRLNSNGTFDKTFDGDGALGIDSGGTERGYGVAVQADGKIIVAGSTSVNTNATVYRLNPNGSFDTSFDGDGALGIDSGATEFAYAVAIQPDGKIVLGGGTTVNNNALIYRVNPDGTLDRSFDGDGALGLDSGGAEIAYDLALQPNGKILLSGITTAGNDGIVFRLNADGAPDTTFDADGQARITEGGVGNAEGIAVAPGGHIVVAGTVNSTTVDSGVARLEGDRPPVDRPQDPDRPEDPRPEDPRPVAYRCAGQVATIVGTNRPDRIKGTRKRDVIVALGGNDRIDGLAGNDIVCAGDGNDTAKGGRGRDQVYGQNGRDKLYGDGEADRLVGGAGNDRLFGGKGRDKLVGGAGKDVARQ